MQHAGIRLPPRHRLETMHTAPSTRNDLDRVTRRADQSIKRRIVASRKPQPPPAGEPPACSRPATRLNPRAGTIVSSDQPSPPQLAIGARHRPRRTPQLSRQHTRRRQRRPRRPTTARDLRRQPLRQGLTHLHQHRYQDSRRHAPHDHGDLHEGLHTLPGPAWSSRGSPGKLHSRSAASPTLRAHPARTSMQPRRAGGRYVGRDAV
jgi:hypothetical protein